jgi:NAD(P)-dependent dehydrogenase (short-subunit alcohol dehydrogenase family)
MPSANADLSGKTILVTGASSGLGQAIAIACCAARGRVVLLGRDVGRLEATRSSCSGEGHIIRAADLSDLDAVPSLVSDICRAVGPLSGLVHSAGVHGYTPLRVITRKHMEGFFTVNAAAAVMLVKGLSARGNHHPGASAVILSSVMGRVAMPGTTAYCMSKGAVEQAVKAMALELATVPIRVNAIAPANIEGPMTQKAMAVLGQEQAQAVRRDHPGGFGAPEDVAAAAVFLLSDGSR